MRRVSRNFSSRRQQGAAAIEFALVFVTFFAVFYGLVTYSLPLLMMQSFNNATAEAVRQSVAISPLASSTPAAYANQVVTQAKAVLGSQLAWIPSAFAFDVTNDAVVSFENGLLKVRINYPKGKLTQVMPILELPGVGSVPNLPAYLSAEASLKLGP